MIDDPEQEGTAFDFKIDDGQLAGLTEQQCFVLGCEFMSIYEKLSHAREFGAEVLGFILRPDNRDRLARACAKFGFAATFTPYAGVPGDDWLKLTAMRSQIIEEGNVA